LTKERKGRSEFRTVSLPAQLVEQVEKIIQEFRYWPTKTDFIREAVIQMLERYKRELKQRAELPETN